MVCIYTLINIDYCMYKILGGFFMKKFTTLALSLILSFSLLLCSCANPQSTPASKSSAPNQTVISNKTAEPSKYNINVKLNPEKRSLAGQEKVRYTNNSTSELKEVYFHIYPNAYKAEATSPTSFAGLNNMYPNGFNPGSLEVSEIQSGESKLNYEIQGEDKTILKIILPKSISSGESVDISMNFSVIIPEASDRFGVLDNCFNFGNWYPIAAVYDETGWNLDPYYKIGDPFYSDASSYDVHITVPKAYTVAATGEPAAEKINGSEKTYNFKEEKVRDFAFVTSNKFTIEQKVVDGINVKCFFLTENKENNAIAMMAAENSIKRFNELYGKYPYKNFSVVETNFGTGMEYPQLVYIGQQYYTSTKQIPELELVIVHETAHQWWYNTVGNDEIDEAWLDESFATYSEGAYFEKKNNSRAYFDNIVKSYTGSERGISGSKVVLRPVSKFQGWNDYGPLVYRKGASMLYELRKEVGDENFSKIMQTYYDKYKFKNAKTKDFIAVVEEVTNKKWNNFFDKWLLDK